MRQVGPPRVPRQTTTGHDHGSGADAYRVLRFLHGAMCPFRASWRLGSLKGGRLPRRHAPPAAHGMVSSTLGRQIFCAPPARGKPQREPARPGPHRIRTTMQARRALPLALVALLALTLAAPAAAAGRKAAKHMCLDTHARAKLLEGCARKAKKMRRYHRTLKCLGRRLERIAATRGSCVDDPIVFRTLMACAKQTKEYVPRRARRHVGYQ